MKDEVEDFLRYADAGKGPSTLMMKAAAQEIRLLRDVAEAIVPVMKDYDRWRLKKKGGRKIPFMEKLRDALKTVGLMDG